MSWVVLDPHGSLALKFAILALYYGMRFIYDAVSGTRHVPGYQFIAPAIHPDPLQVAAINRETVSEVKALLLRAEGKLDATQNPMINQGLDDALMLFLHQSEPVPFWWLQHCFEPWSGVHHYLIANCTDPILANRLAWLGMLSGREREFQIGAAERRLRTLCSCPQFQLRCQPTFDFAGFLNAGGMLILNGESHGNLGRQDATAILCLVLMTLIRLARSGLLRGRVVIIIDEGVYSGLIDGNLLRALGEAAKWGLEIQLIIQNPLDVPERTFGQINRLFIYRQVDPKSVQYMAQLAAMPNLDPYRIHSVERRTRLEHDGYDIEEVISNGTWTSSDGKSGDSENVNVVARARYREKSEEYTKYLSLDDQVRLLQREISRLDVGHCIVRSNNSVSPSPIYIPMEPMPWSGMIVSRNPLVTLAQRKFEAAMEASRSQPEYQTQPLRMPPAPPQRPSRATGRRGGKSGAKRAHD